MQTGTYFMQRFFGDTEQVYSKVPQPMRQTYSESDNTGPQLANVKYT